ncbi:DNA repair ATPase, partial [Streptococcus suis]
FVSFNYRRIMISQSGSIAEASMKLTNIFEEAQKAADLYLYNVKNKIGDVHE